MYSSGHEKVSIMIMSPGIAKHLIEVVTQRPDCAKDASLRKEPLMPTPLPEYPWQMIGSDLFMLDGTTYMYLLVVDYYSRYPERSGFRENPTNVLIFVAR